MSNLLKDASILLTPTAYDDGSMHAIKPENGDGDFDFQRNSAATRVNAQGLVENVQIISSELVSNGNFSEIGTEEVSNGNFSQEGSEQISNGSFDTDSNWTKGTGFSINSGSANCDGTQTANTFLKQQGGIIGSTINFVVGKTYKVNFDIIVTSGHIANIEVASGYDGDNVTTSGNHTTYITAVSTNNRFTITANPDFVGSIDNVSVKEVGQNWTLGANWSIGDGKITSNASGLLQQSTSQLTSGKTYKASFEITEYTSGGVKLYSGSGSDTSTYQNTVGTHVFYFVANGYTTSLYSNNFIGSVTNISVKEVGQGWTLGTGWEIGNNVANAVNAPFGSQLVDSTTLTASKKYSVSFVISNYIQGSVRVAVGNVFSSDVSANGSYTFILTTANTNAFKVQARGGGSGTTLSITNISVKEITDDTNLPRINYEGFSYQDSLGSEEVVNGDFEDGENDWNFGGDWTLVNGTAEIQSSTQSYLRSDSLFPLIVKTYKLQYEVVTTNGSNFRTSGGSSAFGTVTLDSATTGVKTAYLTSNGTQSYLQFNQNSFRGSIDNVSVKEYLGQEVVPDSGCGSWLLEPQSTNLVVNSNDSFEINSGNILYNNAISPDGTQNAYRFESTGASGAFVRTANVAFSTTSSFSVFLKYGNNQWYQIINSSATGFYANVDIQNGVFGTSGSQTENLLIKDYGNGWYRVSGTFTNASGNGTLRVYASSSGSSSWAGASASIGSYNYGYGFQVENQSYSTSYIPTNGATSTRLPDIANNSGNSSLINSTEGVLYAEVSALADDGTIKIISLSEDANVSNRINIFYTSGSNKMKFVVRVNDSNAFIDTITLSNILDYNKVALKYKANDFAIWINGTKESEQLSGSTYPSNTLDKLNFDQGSGNYNFYGKTKALVVYKEALTDANLRCLTYPNPVATTFDLDFDTIAEQFTFTRGSEATFVNTQGLIESTNQIGPELVTNGDFATDSDWSLPSGVTYNSNGYLDCDGSVSSNINQSTSIVSGKQYKVVFEIKNYVSGSTIRIRTGSGSFNDVDVSGNGVYNVSIEADSNTTFRLYPTDLLGSIDNVSVKEVITATNTPRIDYSTGAEAFLLEPQGTNLVTYSEDYGAGTFFTGTSGSTIDNTTSISPSGDANATQLTSTGAGKLQSYTITLSQNTDYVLSFYAKNVDATEVHSRVLDLSGGSGGTNLTSVSYISEISTTEWTRITHSFNTGTGTSFILYLSNILNNGGSIQLWGAQLEQKSYATSYIPTNGASATRNQESTSKNNVNELFDGNVGSIYLAYDGISTNGTTLNNMTPFRLYGQLFNKIRLYYSPDADFLGNGIDFENGGKIAWSCDGTTILTYINGVLIDTHTITSNFTTLSNFVLSTSFMTHRITDIKVYPKALADVQLEDLTTI